MYDHWQRLFFVCFFLCSVWAAPVGAQDLQCESRIQLLAGNHSLSQSQAGELLIGNFHCGACHEDLARDKRFDKLAPDLQGAGSRIRPEYLQRFIESPSTLQPHTSMPELLASKSDEEKRRISLALTHFLNSKTVQTALEPSTDSIDLESGKKLYHSIGCVACHGPREKRDEEQSASPDDANSFSDVPRRPESQTDFEPVAISLDHVAKKYFTGSLAEFLHQPLQVRKSGRMPDMKLSRDEAMSVAAYLTGIDESRKKEFELQVTLVREGQKYFQELRCGACHPMDGVRQTKTSIPLINWNSMRGCLSDASRESPRFQLTASQIRAIVEAQTSPPKNGDSDEHVIAKSLVAWNCIACHTRDQVGGVHANYNSYFTSSEKNLGDDGRIPPPLTLIGAKLQPTWLSKVLLDGESIRPYMNTRMPLFGADNLKHLTGMFERVDTYDGMSIEIPPTESTKQEVRDRAKVLRAAGRELLGDKGLQCIVCHNFNGKPATTNKGMDLVSSYERLKPQWFNAFMRNPNRFRPRIVMPNSWPDGIAVHKEILDGNTDAQLQAIWFYLSLGTSAADPPGIRPANTKLQVLDRVVVHRGRSRVAGFRGIAVGLPEKISYAWNAETGALSAIWKGDFVSVNWNGQGAGDFNPASPAVLLPQDISLAVLENENAIWPSLPTITKESKLNPNPLYPKNLGYQFMGYELDALDTPTFLYRIGFITARDRTVATNASSRPLLQRAITFQRLENDSTEVRSSNAPAIWFRALTGDIEKESDHSFKVNKLRIQISESDVVLRKDPADATRAELLVRIHWKLGKAKLELLYEPLD